MDGDTEGTQPGMKRGTFQIEETSFLMAFGLYAVLKNADMEARAEGSMGIQNLESFETYIGALIELGIEHFIDSDPMIEPAVIICINDLLRAADKVKKEGLV